MKAIRLLLRISSDEQIAGHIIFTKQVTDQEVEMEFLKFDLGRYSCITIGEISGGKLTGRQIHIGETLLKSIPIYIQLVDYVA